MLELLQKKMESLPFEFHNRIKILHDDVTECSWGSGYDAVILGGNCFFELATLDEQKKIFKKAYKSIREGGYIFVDNDSIEDELPDSWCDISIENKAFPSGICLDGIEIKGYVKTTFVDKKNKIWKSIRRVEVYKNNRLVDEYEYEQQKHPIGYSEIVSMIDNSPMEIINVWNGTCEKKIYTLGDGM